ncbi:MAG: glycosyltransferase family 39 protein [Candidatus Levybacteria bacterium]|nr:glycosyltransferase family 39 protein [Candidatus Levybacteria bacterium]
MKQKIAVFLFLIFSAALLAFSIRGNVGNPIYYQSERDTRVGGPFESTNSNARYALTESIVKYGTVFLNPDLAQFSSPDVVEFKGKYFSIFTPGISFVGIPFYALGQQFNSPQLTTYLATTLFAVFNLYLVYKIARRLGGNTIASLLAGFTFIFATNALSYAHTLTQHHMSVTAILLGVLFATNKKNLINAIGFGAVFGMGALFDVPNVIMMAPLGLYMLFSYFSLQTVQNKIKLSIKASVMGLLIGVIPFIMLFGWYNHTTSGSYTLLAQSIGRPTGLSTAPDLKSIKKTQTQTKSDASFKLPFETRAQMNGSYILLLSNERAWIFYSPIVLLGVFGIFLAFRKTDSKTLAGLVASVIIVNVSIYTMFGDPWGGWSFGPRYLIPSAALLSASIGIILTRYNRNFIVIPVFLALFAYSAFISSTGALTTNAIPPKVEAVNLPTPIPYTYEYSFQMLEKNQMSSLMYNLYFPNMLTAWSYTYIYSGVIIAAGISLLTINYFQKPVKK